MQVIIGVDPHKASHTAVAIGEGEDELARKKVRASKNQVPQLLAWAESFPSRVWAIEGADGMGYLLAQQLVATGERVVNVPATLAARARTLGSGRSTKTDPNDALSVAIAALRKRDLRPVEAVGHDEVLRLLAIRNKQLGAERTRLVCRMHALVMGLAAGGIAKEINASDVDRFLASVTPASPAEQIRFDLAVDLLADIRRLDENLKASHKRIREAVAAASSSVTDIYGVGPIIAAMLIGFTGDVRRFETRDKFAAYNGTAPIEISSGGRTIHRLSQRGNRQLNHALHMAAITQIRNPGTEGRVYFDRRVEEGKTKREALRALKRQVSNAVYRQLMLDASRSN